MRQQNLVDTANTMLQMYELLLTHGSDINIKNSYGIPVPLQVGYNYTVMCSDLINGFYPLSSNSILQTMNDVCTQPHQPHMPPSNHTCPPATMHAPQQPHTHPNHTSPLATMHAPNHAPPSNHACPPATMHPLATTHACPLATMHNPPSNHACPPQPSTPPL